MVHSTKQRLLDTGLAMLLEHGYNDLGIQALLVATDTPKGSFYHHFKDKEAFALQVIDQYMRHVHAGLDVCLGDKERPPLGRVRRFFEVTQQTYRTQGYMGCMLGGLGQELSGVSDVFRHKIEWCFSEIVVAVLKQHGHPRIEKTLLGGVRLLRRAAQPFTLAIMCSMTWVCSCCGLNMTISASASTFTLCPGGQ